MDGARPELVIRPDCRKISCRVRHDPRSVAASTLVGKREPFEPHRVTYAGEELFRSRGVTRDRNPVYIEFDVFSLLLPFTQIKEETCEDGPGVSAVALVQECTLSGRRGRRSPHPRHGRGRTDTGTETLSQGPHTNDVTPVPRGLKDPLPCRKWSPVVSAGRRDRNVPGPPLGPVYRHSGRRRTPTPPSRRPGSCERSWGPVPSASTTTPSRLSLDDGVPIPCPVGTVSHLSTSRSSRGPQTWASRPLRETRPCLGLRQESVSGSTAPPLPPCGPWPEEVDPRELSS